MPKPKNPLALKLSLPNTHINNPPVQVPQHTFSSSEATLVVSNHLKKPAKVPRPTLAYTANDISPSTLLALRHSCHKLIIEAEHFDPSHPPPQLPLLSPPRSPAPSTPSLSPCSSTPDDVEGKGRRMSISSVVSPILDMPPKLQHKASQIFQKPMVAAFSYAKAATQTKLTEAAALAKYRMARKDAPPAPTRQPSSDSANKVGLTVPNEPAVVDCGTGEIKTTELYLKPQNDSNDFMSPMLSPMPIPKDAKSIPLRSAKRRPTLITISTSTPGSAAKTAKDTPVAISPPCPSMPPPPVPVLFQSPSQYEPTVAELPGSFPQQQQPQQQVPQKISAAYSIFPHDATPPRPSTAIAAPAPKQKRIPSPLPKFPKQLYNSTSLNASQIGLALGSPSLTAAAQFRAQIMGESSNNNSTPTLFSTSSRADKADKSSHLDKPENKALKRIAKSKSSANLRASIDRPLPPLPAAPVAQGRKTSEWIRIPMGESRKGSVQSPNTDEKKKRWWGLTGIKEGLAQGAIYEIRGGKKVDIGMPEVHLHMPRLDVGQVGERIAGWTGKWGKGDRRM
ncbi:hypothetical protein BJ508DRAFT_414156 [Ascobolus immersus RN42]|uniref:Uncharacterized protein n=1 Tax=Ascobolus immersus RN42 TaxID=1160509 RepID=A0A3N4IA18_ASCIM|nr:hypothetical protein BJ508DRAFT_414156 [Ascobolus immersus RN42]